MTAPAPTTGARSWPALLGLGFATDFLDTLGIGSFATTTAVLRLFRIVDDENIPGTMNVGHAIPTLLECVIFIVLLGGLIDKPTIISMVLAGGIGAWFGDGDRGALAAPHHPAGDGDRAGRHRRLHGDSPPDEPLARARGRSA